MQSTLKANFLQKLMQKWQLKSTFQVAMVLVVFSLTGTTIALLRPFVFDILGFTEQTSFWLKAVAYLLFIFPSYQILILVYGFLLGQFDFFWEREKKLLQRLRLLRKME